MKYGPKKKKRFYFIFSSVECVEQQCHLWFNTFQIAIYLSNSEELITYFFILGDNLCLKHTPAINFHKLLNFITILLCMPRLKAEYTAETSHPRDCLFIEKNFSNLWFFTGTSRKNFLGNPACHGFFYSLFFCVCALSGNYIHTLNT